MLRTITIAIAAMLLLIYIGAASALEPNNEPNDPCYQEGYQWNLTKINAWQGWDEIYHKCGRVGNPDINIAIIDESFDGNHPDLNGWIGDAGTRANKEHGTHCAGIAAGDSNNGIGIAGVAWGCTLMFVSNCFTIDELPSKMRIAADNGARVISYSNNFLSTRSDLIEAVRYAVYEKGCIIVVSAANNKDNIDEIPYYPACLDGVICVGATDRNDVLTTYSNYGERIDVVAPGGTHCGGDDNDIDNILSTKWSSTIGSYYGYLGGTSMAAPHVAGLAALCLSVDSNLTLTPADVKMLICSYADDLGEPGKDIYYGCGRINVYRTIHAIGTMTAPTEANTPEPNDDSKNISKRVTLSWTAGANSSSHRIFLGTNVNALDFKTEQFNFNTTFQPQDLKAGTQYYWKIVEKNFKGETNSPVWTFTTAPSHRIYVDVTHDQNTPDGQSWGTSYTRLEDALNTSQINDEIWIADGNYIPDTNIATDPNDPRTASFHLPADVDIYGGFCGPANDMNGETSISQRRLDIYETILNGDINVLVDYNDNCYHVVIGASRTIIDGVSIKYGFANGSGSDANGAGLYNNGVGCTIRYCLFANNTASSDGGAVYCSGKPVEITNCRFIDNIAGRGAGLYGGSLVDINILNCLFAGNVATARGGGIYSKGNNIVTVDNSTFTGNKVSGTTSGGAADVYRDSLLRFRNSILAYDEPYEVYAVGGNMFVKGGGIGIVEANYCNILNGSSEVNAIKKYIDPNTKTGDPGFITNGYWDSNNKWVHGDYHLRPDSNCVNAGDLNGFYDGKTDIDGDNRVLCGRVDIGADEAMLCPPPPSQILYPLYDPDCNIPIYWSSAEGATSYEMERSNNGGGYVNIYTGTATNKGDLGLTPGLYHYRVRACNAVLCSNYLIGPNDCNAYLSTCYRDGDTADPNWAQWVSVGRPDCWCKASTAEEPNGSGYQCDGDADGTTGGANYRVYSNDQGMIVTHYKKTAAQLTADPNVTLAGKLKIQAACADIDHKTGGANYRVYNIDQSIIGANWKKLGSSSVTATDRLPCDCPR